MMLTEGTVAGPSLLRSGCSVYFFGRKKQRNPVVVGDPRLQPFELQNKSVVGGCMDRYDNFPDLR